LVETLTFLLNKLNDTGVAMDESLTVASDTDAAEAAAVSAATVSAAALVALAAVSAAAVVAAAVSARATVSVAELLAPPPQKWTKIIKLWLQ
jgi:hypothetical protein